MYFEQLIKLCSGFLSSASIALSSSVVMKLLSAAVSKTDFICFFVSLTWVNKADTQQDQLVQQVDVVRLQVEFTFTEGSEVRDFQSVMLSFLYTLQCNTLQLNTVIITSINLQPMIRKRFTGCHCELVSHLKLHLKFQKAVLVLHSKV